MLTLGFFSNSFRWQARLFLWDISCFLRKACIAMNLPLRNAFAVSYRFCKTFFSLSFSGGIFWLPLYFHHDSSVFSSMLSLITAWNWVIDVASTCAIYWPHSHTSFHLLYEPPINKDGINYLAWKTAHQAETGERYANLKSWCFSSYKKWTGNRGEMIV